MAIHEPDGMRMVRRMTFYYYPWPLTELTPLRNDRSKWLKVCFFSCDVSSDLSFAFARPF